MHTHISIHTSHIYIHNTRTYITYIHHIHTLTYITHIHTSHTYIHHTLTYITHIHTSHTYINHTLTYIIHIHTSHTYIHNTHTYKTYSRCLSSYQLHTPPLPFKTCLISHTFTNPLSLSPPISLTLSTFSEPKNFLFIFSVVLKLIVASRQSDLGTSRRFVKKAFQRNE